MHKAFQILEQARNREIFKAERAIFGGEKWKLFKNTTLS